jgi:hypothetical protein
VWEMKLTSFSASGHTQSLWHTPHLPSFIDNT